MKPCIHGMLASCVPASAVIPPLLQPSGAPSHPRLHYRLHLLFLPTFHEGSQPQQPGGLCDSLHRDHAATAAAGESCCGSGRSTLLGDRACD